DFMKTTSPGQKKVMTGWKFSGAPAAAAPASPSQPAVPAPDTSKPKYGANTAAPGPLQGLCWQYTNNKFFITRPFPWGNRPPSEHVDDDFRDFVVKTYGTQPGGTV